MGTVIMQIVDACAMDLSDDGADDDREYYTVKLFGVTPKGARVCAHVTGYTPYFYVGLPECMMTPQTAAALQRMIVDRLPRHLLGDAGRPKDLKGAAWTAFADRLARVSLVHRQELVGFQNGEQRALFKIVFPNHAVFRFVKFRVISRRVEPTQEGGEVRFVPATLTLGGQAAKAQPFETNIDPLLRFLHFRDLEPAGWVRLENATEDPCVRAPAGGATNYTVDASDVRAHSRTSMAPLTVMSFDIECTSSHGDFPVARKGYGKTANELLEWYRAMTDAPSGKDPWGEDGTKALLPMLCGMLLVDDPDHPGVRNKTLSRVYPKRRIADKGALRETIRSNIDDIVNALEGKPSNTDDPDDPPTPADRTARVLARCLPPLKGDPIIQIGSTVHRYGEADCSYKCVFALDSCDPIPGVHVVSCKTERDLIVAWCEEMRRIDPDVVTGYNILGFDLHYLHTRAEEQGCARALESLGRLDGVPAPFRERMLSSSALGDNSLRYYEWTGRVVIDMMKLVQRDHKLDSYRLDAVAGAFIKGRVREVLDDRTLVLDRTHELNVGDFLKIGDTKHRIGAIERDTVALPRPLEEATLRAPPPAWGLVKDDVSPNMIFACQKGSSADRAVIAKYCVQDCALCNLLMIKLETLANNIGMANVCTVPLSYIFMRGQGVKIFSLVAKQCKRDGFVVPVISRDLDADDEGYEGAIVLDPTPGIYTQPVSVMDYASLYPSSMISENISHDSIVLDPNYDNLPGVEYVDVTYDVPCKNEEGVKQCVCRFAQFPDGTKGVLPRILQQLLGARKSTRKRMLHQLVETREHGQLSGEVREIDVDTLSVGGVEVRKDAVLSRRDLYDDFAKAVLDGLQLAYKVTANSLYGQVGARTSPIYLKELAASTTATGRNLILRAKRFMEEHYGATTVYGDTDSVFVDFDVQGRYGLEGVAALQKSIDLSIEASTAFKKELKAPHDLEYEKTFWPFIILAKKKYIGNLYEHDVHKFKQKGMGIVLKRRDNANILKIVYGGIIDLLLRRQPLLDALDFLQESLRDLVKGKFPLEDLVITKTLRGSYADPTRIAHKVLQLRMLARDPGSAPQVNDRIPYVYVEHDRKNKSLLQGDKIEHPDYIRANQLLPDYTFYISNQLQNPISQLLALRLEDLPGYRKGANFYESRAKKLRYEGLPEAAVQKRVALLREVDTRELLFKRTLVDLELRRTGARKITDFFG